MHIHNWFYLSKADRRSFAILLIVLIIITGVRVFFYRSDNTSDVAVVSEQEKLAIENFEEAIRKDSIERNLRYKKYEKPTRTIETFPFDPNTADSATLLRLGLAPWQISNMMKYRKKNGEWRSPDDFSRLYGLSKEDFVRLRPYIRISKGLTEKENQRKSASADSTRINFPHIEKYAEGTLVDLNVCDTTELKKIPGIGSYYAGKICRYRERLGGFLNASQIREVEGLPENIERWFVVQSNAPVRRLNVNKASFKELARHPYLTYDQVKVIDSYIKLYGKISSWEELMLSNEFENIDKKKLDAYFYFN